MVEKLLYVCDDVEGDDCICKNLKYMGFLNTLEITFTVDLVHIEMAWKHEAAHGRLSGPRVKPIKLR